MKSPALRIILLAVILIGIVGCATSPASGPGTGPGNPPAPGNAPVPGQGNNPPSGPGFLGVSGTVKSVSGNTIEMTGQDGKSVSVKTSDQTTYQKSSSVTLADLKAGDTISAMGDQSGTEITARSVQIGIIGGMGPGGGAGPRGGTPPAGKGAPQGGPPPGNGQGGNGNRSGVAGTITSINGNTIQVTGQDGKSVSVKIDANTAFIKTISATLAEVKTGDQVMALGESSSETLTARIIQIGAMGR
jgi:hypothetical protein